MQTVRLARLALPGALAAALLAPSAIAQQPGPDYRSLFVKSGKKTVQAKLGAYCHPNAGPAGECGGDFSRQGMGAITVRRDGELLLLLRYTASEVEWQAARLTSSGKETGVRTGRAVAKKRTKGKRWVFTLPRNLSKSTKLLRFNVRYPHAFSSFQLGVTKVLDPVATSKTR
ncbi:MAG TPA: hypothetical protein VD931_08095 [Baekduia sp.]|nr:hypothetical protein [Baekduia sp.]